MKLRDFLTSRRGEEKIERLREVRQRNKRIRMRMMVALYYLTFTSLLLYICIDIILHLRQRMVRQRVCVLSIQI